MARVASHLVAGDPGVRGAEQQDSAAPGVHWRIAMLAAELVVPEHDVAPHPDVAGAAALPVVKHQDALAVPGQPVAVDADAAGMPDEDPELVAHRAVVAHDRGGVRRVADVETGLVVSYRRVIREQRPGGGEARDPVAAVVDRHDMDHPKADGAVTEHAGAAEAGVADVVREHGGWFKHRSAVEGA